jgi:O-phosphoseryl-tRNA synthetase
MILHGAGDVREMVYSQLYADLAMSDEDIASMINAEKSPKTEEGLKIAKEIVKACEKYASEKSPCEFEVYTSEKIKVKLTEHEENKNLLGPATFNDIFVSDGNIYGLPPGKSEDIRKNGVDCSIRYIDAIASLAAHNIEKSVEACEKESITSVQMARSLGDINLVLDDVALRYITANNKLIDIRGPIFITVEATIAQD